MPHSGILQEHIEKRKKVDTAQLRLSFPHPPALCVLLGRTIFNLDCTSYQARRMTYMDLMSVPEAPGSVKVLEAITRRMCGRVYILGICSATLGRLFQCWFTENDFFRRTSIPQEHLLFCRLPRFAAAAIRENRVTHLVGDSIAAVSDFSEYIAHVYVIGNSRHSRRFPNVQAVPTWEQLVGTIVP